MRNPETPRVVGCRSRRLEPTCLKLSGVLAFVLQQIVASSDEVIVTSGYCWEGAKTGLNSGFRSTIVFLAFLACGPDQAFEGTMGPLRTSTGELNPEDPHTQYLRYLAPVTTPAMSLGPQKL